MTVLPKLEIQPGSPLPGDTVQFNFNGDEVTRDAGKLYVAWFDGLTVQYSDLSDDNKAVVPQLQGTVYAAIVNEQDGSPTAQALLTGLVMFEVNFPSYVGNP